ncbi:MAG TPA: V-type ATP synthase subunit A [Candidatus Methanofastidiosa archaeon]|nr:V-type ATP synthase subunit A [Candidatus Methanofastidiosa archaeon]HPR41021.1 V-type ATP synthase subunit A [Candidatus Methanofastidiosa archaeon]
MEIERNVKVARINRVSGPVVVVNDLDGRMYDVVLVSNKKLMGEIIEIDSDKTIVQVYEDTDLIRPDEPVYDTREPVSVELGPGLLSSIFDGIQRPLDVIAETGDFVRRGLNVNSLSREKKWKFIPLKKVGEDVAPGEIIGYVDETKNFRHGIMAPPEMSGTVTDIKEGEFTITDVICILDGKNEVRLMHRWPVKKRRPIREKLWPDEILVTGQRVLDSLFPIAKGGTAAIPGPFGSGKTITQHQLAKWSNADVVVYVGCGERGNEMTSVLDEFPKLTDPKTGSPLLERVVLIANTSNMPVAAREASVYTGITIAEYFRDMGYNVALMADSTSRWAEAMREISSRLEELPGEEGYPAYLGSRLASFYERAGYVETLSGKKGSVTIIGAVSPAGGDFSEPVTQNTLRVTKVFWALDAKLANRRHFPSINWLKSYSLYQDHLTPLLERDFPGWKENRNSIMNILVKESELEEIVQLVGSDALPEDQKLTLEVARMIREYFLQQDAFHEVDTYCNLEKQYLIIKAILEFSEKARGAIDVGKKIEKIVDLPCRAMIGKARFEKDYLEYLEKVSVAIQKDFNSLLRGDEN